MIIYTPLTMDEVFPTDPTQFNNKKTIPIKHGVITLEKREETWLVCSLHSSNPVDYLRSDYQPGTIWSAPLEEK